MLRPGAMLCPTSGGRTSLVVFPPISVRPSASARVASIVSTFQTEDNEDGCSARNLHKPAPAVFGLLKFRKQSDQSASEAHLRCAANIAWDSHSATCRASTVPLLRQPKELYSKELRYGAVNSRMLGKQAAEFSCSPW